MSNDSRGDYHIPSRDAAILEALAIDRTTLMVQTVWHTAAGVLFEEMQRFNNRLQTAAAPLRLVSQGPAGRTRHRRQPKPEQSHGTHIDRHAA